MPGIVRRTVDYAILAWALELIDGNQRGVQCVNFVFDVDEGKKNI